MAPRTEVAQPVFADYWLHNRGPAPMGYQPVAVHIRPDRASGPGPFVVPVSVASSRMDGPVAGTVTVVVPPGWTADPSERPFRLAPGAHLAFEASVAAPRSAPPGRNFVAARIADETGQVHEDVLTIDLQPGEGPIAVASERSAALAGALRRTRRREDEVLADGDAASGPVDAMGRGPVRSEATPAAPMLRDLGDELEVTLLTPTVAVQAGRRGALRVSLRNAVLGEIRGEAQLISPHDTWPITSPWTMGFAVAPDEEVTLSFAVEPPSGFRAGSWWGLVKVMYFGRVVYTEAATIEVRGGAIS
jgi:hypothetical protein